MQKCLCFLVRIPSHFQLGWSHMLRVGMSDRSVFGCLPASLTTVVLFLLSPSLCVTLGAFGFTDRTPRLQAHLPCFPNTEAQTGCKPRFHMSAGHLDADPRACTTSTLLVEAAPQSPENPFLIAISIMERRLWLESSIAHKAKYPSVNVLIKKMIIYRQ